jgi:uncharacterized protein (DUF58 family)
MKSVAAAEVAALGAWRALNAGDRVGGIVFNETEIVQIRPHRSQTAVLRLLHEIVRLNEALASGEPRRGEVTLNHAIEGALRVAKHDHLVVLVSDLDGADEETQRLATSLAAHNDVLVVAVYDPLGASLTGAHNMTATDRGRVWSIPDSAAFAQAFQAEFVHQVEHWMEVFRYLRIPVLPISTAHPPAEQIRALFGQQAGKP